VLCLSELMHVVMHVPQVPHELLGSNVLADD
jgi:hypothetical protein